MYDYRQYGMSKDEAERKENLFTEAQLAYHCHDLYTPANLCVLKVKATLLANVNYTRGSINANLLMDCLKDDTGLEFKQYRTDVLRLDRNSTVDRQTWPRLSGYNGPVLERVPYLGSDLSKMPYPEVPRFGSKEHTKDLLTALVQAPLAASACPGPGAATPSAGDATIWHEDTLELQIPPTSECSDADDLDKTLILPQSDSDDEESEEPIVTRTCPQDLPLLQPAEMSTQPIAEPFWRYMFRGERANWTVEQKVAHIRYVRQTQTFPVAHGQRWRKGEFMIPRVKKVPMEGCENCNASVQHTELDRFPRCNPLILFCAYPRCSAPMRQGHMIEKCPDLNEICSNCYMRGKELS